MPAVFQRALQAGINRHAMRLSAAVESEQNLPNQRQFCGESRLRREFPQAPLVFGNDVGFDLLGGCFQDLCLGLVMRVDAALRNAGFLGDIFYTETEAALPLKNGQRRCGNFFFTPPVYIALEITAELFRHDSRISVSPPCSIVWSISSVRNSVNDANWPVQLATTSRRLTDQSQSDRIVTANGNAVVKFGIDHEQVRQSPRY